VPILINFVPKLIFRTFALKFLRSKHFQTSSVSERVEVCSFYLQIVFTCAQVPGVCARRGDLPLL
jgi:hypothetical protein